MTKLGRDWHVPQKLHGEERKPADVAKDLEQDLTAPLSDYLETIAFRLHIVVL